ncbi:hypothetical protein HMPREF1640_00015 [Prevotella sp. S7-1-8]|nr:hypothetical protein HMPREF1640_00015 [Prevotella sp. S7-1-8]
MENTENRVFASGEPVFCEDAFFQRLFVVFFQRWAHGVPMMWPGRCECCAGWLRRLSRLAF